MDIMVMNLKFFREYKYIGVQVLICTWLLALPFTAQAAQLEGISHSSLPGNKVQVRLSFSAPVGEPVSFVTDNPARIVLDFMNSGLNLRQRNHIVGLGALQSVSVVETQQRLRVVLNLVNSADYLLQTSENNIILTLDNLSNQISAPQRDTNPILKASLPTTSQSAVVPVISSALSNPTPPTPSRAYAILGPHIAKIDFRRSDDRAGLVMITLSDPEIMSDMRTEGRDIIVDFVDAALPEKLDRRLDVIDFATPVTHVDTQVHANNVRVRITTVGEYEHLAYQTGNTYVIEIKELSQEEKAEKQKTEPVYTGQKVSFSFQEISVRAALLLLTELPGVNLNLVASESVKGNITLRLRNVPWDQALDIILESNGLGMRRLGNVIMVDDREKLNERERKELEAQQEIQRLEPLRTEYIQVNYAKAEDFETLLKSKSSSEKGHSFLSDRGNVSIDTRTNTLVIQDTAQRLAEIRQLLGTLDSPVRQVLIESRVVIAEDTFGRSLGVRFGYSGNQRIGSEHGVVVGGKVAGNTTFSQGTSFTGDNTLTTEGGQGENFIVSLPETIGIASNAALGLAIGKIGSYLLNLELSALQQEGRGEIIASPRVITANQKKATIYQGQERAFRAAAGVGATADVQFKEAVLKLEVTPQITPDDRVIMELLVEKDDFLPVAGGEPPISKRAVETNVLVDNGETVVLGGVYERNQTNSIERVPFFSDIPVLGNLFKRRSRTDAKSELLIFVTPKILTDAS
jgi:type IV pilus assembly protein PilQ